MAPWWGQQVNWHGAVTGKGGGHRRYGGSHKQAMPPPPSQMQQAEGAWTTGTVRRLFVGKGFGFVSRDGAADRAPHSRGDAAKDSRGPGGRARLVSLAMEDGHLLDSGRPRPSRTGRVYRKDTLLVARSWMHRRGKVEPRQLWPIRSDGLPREILIPFTIWMHDAYWAEEHQRALAHATDEERVQFMEDYEGGADEHNAETFGDTWALDSWSYQEAVAANAKLAWGHARAARVPVPMTGPPIWTGLPAFFQPYQPQAILHARVCQSSSLFDPPDLRSIAMFLINYMETLAFAMLGYDASQGRTKHISLQTCVALTLSLVLGGFNLPRDFGRRLHKLILVFVGCCCGTWACYGVAKDTQAEGEDGLPAKASQAVIYVSSFVLGLILFVACRFSPQETVQFMFTDLQSSVCTFQNFLHALALLPQLVLCRRKHFVSPAALRFLFLLGTKHLYEFVTDAYVSYQHYLRGRLHLHEFSFMSGDFFAALILLDFLYLVLTDEGTLLLLLGTKEMELLDEEAATEMPQPTRCQKIHKALQQWLEGSQETLQQAFDDAVEPYSMKGEDLFVVAGTTVVVFLGVQLGILNVYACLGAALVFGSLRAFQLYQDQAFQMPQKGQKCCL
eukprot:g32037.t2